jgi:hypothetical protein
VAPTDFAWLWKDAVDRRIAEAPEYAAALGRMIRRLNGRDDHGGALDDVVSQPWGNPRRDWYDAAALFEVAQYLQVGWYVTAVVPVGEEPGRDKDLADNQRKLDRLPEPYSARCASGAGDNDGRFVWLNPVSVEHRMQDNERLVVTYAPTDVPLEIGHTDPATTIWHMWEEGGVARWPYGHKRITLLLATWIPGRGRIGPGRPEIIVGRWLVEPTTSITDPLQDALAGTGDR